MLNFLALLTKGMTKKDSTKLAKLGATYNVSTYAISSKFQIFTVRS